MENGENKNLQGRREFFKEAAKKALPIIGAVALMSNPMFANAMKSETTDCSSGCYASCTGTCSGGCKGRCDTECALACGGSCKGGCQGGCSSSCYASCYGGSK